MRIANDSYCSTLLETFSSVGTSSNAGGVIELQTVISFEDIGIARSCNIGVAISWFCPTIAVIFAIACFHHYMINEQTIMVWLKCHKQRGTDVRVVPVNERSE